MSAETSSQPQTEYTGGPVDYYKVKVEDPTSLPDPYTAECNDIIEALEMGFAEGEAFKAIWRGAAERVLKKGKRGGEIQNAIYNAEKVQWMGGRMLAQAKRKARGAKPA